MNIKIPYRLTWEKAGFTDKLNLSFSIKEIEIVLNDSNPEQFLSSSNTTKKKLFKEAERWQKF